MSPIGHLKASLKIYLKSTGLHPDFGKYCEESKLETRDGMNHEHGANCFDDASGWGGDKKSPMGRTDSVRLDPDWYMVAEEVMIAGDEEHNLLAQYDLGVIKEAEIKTKQVRKISARQAQYNADNNLWEANRMVTSGVATRKALDLDLKDHSVHGMVHDLKPPFFDGRTVFKEQLEPFNHHPRPNEKREQAERAKAAAKLAALWVTALGNIMGVRDEEADAEADAEKQAKGNPNGEENFRGDSQFASHLKSSTAMSSFARNRTLKEQREYLPAFACREDILRTVRDNQVVVVVGETGSGKTTQLAQSLSMKTDIAIMESSVAHSLDVSRRCPVRSVSARKWR
ncbi:hypothetical protein BD410DRAFT_846490 [Rickenella mellea]|uniref:Helicase ATP-binding domain-containing protein n=1 Tax=Rickenella mellea TaxID=50990 RepID=A0A4Y7PGG1_9AGAM|nr:hypothetical protein BD410DRAFT_846490 [Rickenella mellea]